MKEIVVNDYFQKNYKYILTEPIGQNFHNDFNPQLTPMQMLNLGVFGGKYMTDCTSEFPQSWFNKAKLSPNFKNINLNYFKVDASLPLKNWIDKGWIYKDDPRGWFQWYCRYFFGRRIDNEDIRQINRWKAIKRHLGAVKKNCTPLDLECRKKAKTSFVALGL